MIPEYYLYSVVYFKEQNMKKKRYCTALLINVFYMFDMLLILLVMPHVKMLVNYIVAYLSLF